MEFSERVKELAPEGAYQVLAKAQALEAQGREIIHLEIGEPDFEAGENIKAAGIAAILLPLWWMPWGQVLLAPYKTVSVMIPGSLVLALGQWFVLGRIGESSRSYVVLTCVGVAIGGYLGLIAAFVLSLMTGALLPLEHAWALLFGLTVGAFQSRPLARVIDSVDGGLRTG